MTNVECSEGNSFKGTDLNRIETKKNKEKQREIKKMYCPKVMTTKHVQRETFQSLFGVSTNVARLCYQL